MTSSNQQINSGTNALTQHEWNILLCANDFFASEVEFWQTALLTYGNVNILKIVDVEHAFYAMTGRGISEAIENLKFLASINNAIENKCDHELNRDGLHFLRWIQNKLDDRGWKQLYADHLAHGFSDYYLLPSHENESVPLAHAIARQHRGDRPLPKGDNSGQYCRHCGWSGHIAAVCPAAGVVKRVKGRLVSYGNKPRCFVCGTRNFIETENNFHSSENCPLRHPLSRIGVNRACTNCGLPLVRCWNCAVPTCKNRKGRCPNATHRLHNCSRPRYVPFFGDGNCAQVSAIKKRMLSLGIRTIPRELRFVDTGTRSLPNTQVDAGILPVIQGEVIANEYSVAAPANAEAIPYGDKEPLTNSQQIGVSQLEAENITLSRHDGDTMSNILTAVENAIDIQAELEICIVCINDINIRAYVRTNCNHKFHEDCYHSMVKYRACLLKKECPLCRTKDIDVVERIEPIGVNSANEPTTDTTETSASVWTTIVPTEGPFMHDPNYWTVSGTESNQEWQTMAQLDGQRSFGRGRGRGQLTRNGRRLFDEYQTLMSEGTSTNTVGETANAGINTDERDHAHEDTTHDEEIANIMAVRLFLEENERQYDTMKRMLQETIADLSGDYWAVTDPAVSERFTQLRGFLAVNEVSFDTELIHLIGVALFRASQWENYYIRNDVIPALLAATPVDRLPEVMNEFESAAENLAALAIGYENLQPFIIGYENANEEII